MVRVLTQVWQRFRDFIAFASLLIGIVYMPADLFGLADTYPLLGRLAAMLDRFTVLAAFSAILVAYIFWIDLRPLIRSRLGHDIKNCLRVGRFDLQTGGISQADGAVLLQLKFAIHNDSPDSPLYFLMEVGDLSIDSRVNPDTVIAMSATRIAPNSSLTVTLAGIMGLERKQIYDGKARLEFRYGPTADNLKFSLRENAALRIQIDQIDEKQFLHDVMVSHRDVVHGD